MNIKISSFLVGAIALSLSAGCVSQAHAAPLSVGGVQQYKLAQEPNDNRLNFTPEQKKRVEEIHSAASQNIFSLLNDTQKTQWQNAVTNHQKRDRSFWQSLNLDATQKTQIQQIQRDAAQNIYKNVMTSEQQQKVQAMRKNHPHPPQ